MEMRTGRGICFRLLVVAAVVVGGETRRSCPVRAGSVRRAARGLALGARARSQTTAVAPRIPTTAIANPAANQWRRLRRVRSFNTLRTIAEPSRRMLRLGIEYRMRPAI
jgi:hypothetical protein